MNRNSTYVNITCTSSHNTAFRSFLSRLFTLILLVTGFSLVALQGKSQHVCNNAPDMVLQNPTLIAGTDGVPGAIYLFSLVIPGVDCTIEIMSLHGGALLGEIDNTTQGYNDAWQPYVTAGANDTSYLEWKITFKKAGTNIDTILSCVAITAVDCDGDNANLKEFIQAATPGAYAVSIPTTLSVTYDGTFNRAIGSITTIPLIDTAHREAMYQMNFGDVSTIIYRNGSISTKNSIDVRHTCIYFKPFFDHSSLIPLPVKLLSFVATSKPNETVITWSVTEEKNMQHYTVQKSSDGVNWTDIDRISAANKGAVVHTYYSHDAANTGGVVFYRLLQTDWQQNKSYSKIVFTGGNASNENISYPTIVAKLLPIRITAATTDEYTVRIHSLQGQLMAAQKHSVQAGTSNITVALPLSSPGSTYVVSITNRQGRVIHSSKIFTR